MIQCQWWRSLFDVEMCGRTIQKREVLIFIATLVLMTYAWPALAGEEKCLAL